MAKNDIPVQNNIIYTQKKGYTSKNGRETVLLGAERVTVGVDTGEKEIAKDKLSGYNYERNKIEAKTIYDLSAQRKKCFFVLDLETGTRGWYPGSVRVCDINGYYVPIKKEKSDDSETVITVSNVTAKVLDLEYDDSKQIWYKLYYNSNVGYVKNSYISNVRYVDPY